MERNQTPSSDPPSAAKPRWTDQLEPEDLVFIKRFVMASGSLKSIAKTYGVSYPTIRARLDRLIGKLELLDSNTHTDPFERAARLRAADGRIDPAILPELLRLHRETLNNTHPINQTNNQTNNQTTNRTQEPRNDHPENATH